MTQTKVKLKVNNIDKSTGIGPITAKFPGGLPSTMMSNNAQFSLLMHKKGNKRILINEDIYTQILFYDNHNISYKNKNNTQTMPQNKLIYCISFIILYDDTIFITQASSEYIMLILFLLIITLQFIYPMFIYIHNIFIYYYHKILRQIIGVYNEETKELELTPVYDSFTMKQIHNANYVCLFMISLL